MVKTPDLIPFFNHIQLLISPVITGEINSRITYINDSLKIKHSSLIILLIFFILGFILPKILKMKKIDVKTAKACIAAFNEKMKKLGITSPATGLTNSVGFQSDELQKWIESVKPFMAELRIVFGVYTKELSTENEGRFTLFLWPYDEKGGPATGDDGEEIPPLNMGDLIP